MKKRLLKKLLCWIMIITFSISTVPVLATEKKETVDEIIRKMSLRDKIMQMMMLSFRYWDENPQDSQEQVNFTEMNDQVSWIVENYKPGAVIYFAQNLEETKQSYELTMKFQEAAMKNDGLPMMICADQEGGLVYRLKSGTAMPGNMALGATSNPQYSYLTGQVIGSELNAIGINTNLAPVVDVNNNANNPVIGLRSYSDDPKVVGEMASEAMKGIAESDVISCAKHFPGHGDTSVDSHYGLPCVDKSLDELKNCELMPYETLIAGGIDMIMTAHILYSQLEKDTIYSLKTGKEEALPATMSDDIITGLLKESMGFEGIVVTDAMNMEGITNSWDEVQAVVNAIAAGVDMICMPCNLTSMEDVASLEKIIEGIEAAVQEENIPVSRIDDAVTRILTVKHKFGILDWNASKYSLENAMTIVGSDYNRTIERQTAAAAVTVVQNKNNTLPLKIKKRSKVLVMVPYKNEEAQMLMGWNRAKEAGLIPNSAKVRSVCFDENTTLKTYKKDIRWADTVIIISEIGSAAKMNGGSWESAYPLEVISYAEKKRKTTIVQSVSKPYDVQSYPMADAVLAVYGSKGSGVDPTEALVGGITKSQAACGPNIIAGMEVILGIFGAKGTLPVDIPEFINGEYTSKIVFPRGYGIVYESLSQSQVSETFVLHQESK
ncbi:MAG: glycoside hydrolase family 3 protein [Lachnospiraceae bacterium]|nr:glycoside hydrolase family 3 protein [Lachnospiraceae bacterium]